MPVVEFKEWYVGLGSLALLNAGLAQTNAGLPVNASGVTPDGKPFEDITGLRKLLSQQPEKLAWGVTWHLATYATGAPSGPLDPKAIQQIIPPHTLTPVRVLTVSGAAGAKAIS